MQADDVLLFILGWCVGCFMWGFCGAAVRDYLNRKGKRG